MTETMQKYYNEDGKVAVLFSPDYGAGWSTWNKLNQMIFDPEIVEFLLSNTFETPEDKAMAIENKFRAKYHDAYFGGADNLKICWLEPNTQFYIKEYDGSESIVTNNDVKWITA